MFFIQGSVASCIHWRLWWLSVACVVLSFTCLPQEKCAFHVFVCHWENAKKRQIPFVVFLLFRHFALTYLSVLPSTPLSKNTTWHNSTTMGERIKSVNRNFPPTKVSLHHQLVKPFHRICICVSIVESFSSICYITYVIALFSFSNILRVSEYNFFYRLGVYFFYNFQCISRFRMRLSRARSNIWWNQRNIAKSHRFYAWNTIHFSSLSKM